MKHANIGVLEGGDNAGFALEALAHFRIAGEVRREQLDGDHSVQPRILRFVNLAHSPGANGAKNAVWTKLRPLGKRGHGLAFPRPACQYRITVSPLCGMPPGTAALTPRPRMNPLGIAA